MVQRDRITEGERRRGVRPPLDVGRNVSKAVALVLLCLQEARQIGRSDLLNLERAQG
jgi:hypothetical protein